MLYLEFPSLPISSDHAYESGIVMKGKGKARKRIVVRRLSDAGKKYKSDLKSHLLRTYPEALTFFQQDMPYLLIVEFTFKGRGAIYNQTWMDLDEKKRAQNRYKKLDVSNRTKLFEDALAEASGLDDRHNFFVGVGKTWSRHHEMTRCWVFNREAERDNPVDDLLWHLKATGRAQPHGALPGLP